MCFLRHSSENNKEKYYEHKLKLKENALKFNKRNNILIKKSASATFYEEKYSK